MQTGVRPKPSLLWPADAAQALRMRRCLLGLASYFMFVVPLGYMNHYGWLKFGTPGLLWLAAVVLTVNLAFLLLIRSGLNLRFADPSLTVPQIAVASVIIIYVLAIAREGRGALLLLYFTSFFFGVFRLNSREFMQLTLLAILLYLGYLTWQWQHAAPGAIIEVEILRFLVLAVVLVWMSFVGGYVARLRAELRSKNAELERALARVQELLVHDELTKAYNRRYLMEILRREQSRVDRRRSDTAIGFSLCILDLDHFKDINDRYGHLAGDRVLQEFAERVRRQIRHIDWLARAGEPGTFARYGGEEFVLVLPDTDAAGALTCAERIRNAVSQETFRIDGLQLTVSISAGVSEYRPKETLEELLKRADAALYEAKARGRNCVVQR